MISDSTNDTGKPVSDSVLGSEGRNDSSAIIVASRLLIGMLESDTVDMVWGLADFSLGLSVKI
jgi:hypothetical protein